VKALRQELTTLQSTIEENATEHDKHVKEIQEAKSRAELLAEQLSQEVRTLKETLSSCPTREDLARKEQEISHVRSELDRKEIELKKMEISFESLRGEASGKVDVGIVEQLKDSNERFKNDIAELKRDLKEREERLSSLQRTLLEAPKQDFVDQLQSQLKDLKEEGMKRDGKMRELEATHLQLEGELQRAPKAQDLERC
jgi:chromosome segregation ATPase